MELKELIVNISSLMSVSGYEEYDKDKLTELISGYFDENYTDKTGNMIFVRRCGRDHVPKIMIDTHFDELGMYVTDICEGGFLRVTNIGGMDTGILQASDVIIYGKSRKIFGVVASTPPHLASGRSDELVKFDEVLIDTGYTKEELEKEVRIGTPIGFSPVYTELLGNKIMGKGFDDKSCVACAVYALANILAEKLAGDVYLMLSRGEEVFPASGALTGTFALKPDYAMVMDVNLGRVPSVEKEDTVELGKGASVSVSAVTDRTLTKLLCKSAGKNNIPIQIIAAPSSTGTNASSIQLVGNGVPVVDVGLPLVSMHTFNEIINLDDAKSLADLVETFVCDGEIAEKFGSGGGII